MMTETTATSQGPAHAVDRLVPFVHVNEVEVSLAFYAMLGFVPMSVMRDGHRRPFWALAQSGTAEVMLARASGPIDAGQQAVLLYMYCRDVVALRRHLLASGVHDGGVYHGARGAGDRGFLVYEVSHPGHMPAGELRIADPDEYVILVGQLA